MKKDAVDDCGLVAAVRKPPFGFTGLTVYAENIHAILLL